MRRILSRTKMNLIKQNKRYILKSIIFLIFFTMFFTSLYIEKVSQLLENNILSKYDIYVELKLKENLKESLNLDEYAEKLHKFINMYNDLKDNENVIYSDLNNVLGYSTPIHLVYQDKDQWYYFREVYGWDKDSLIEHYLLNKEYCETENTSICQYDTLSYIKGISQSEPMDFHFNVSRLDSGRFFTQEEIDQGEFVCIVPMGYHYYTIDNNQIVKKSVSSINQDFIISILIKNKDGTHYYKPYTFKVIGFYNPLNYNFDDTYVYIPNKVLDKLNKECVDAVNTYLPSYYENNYADFKYKVNEIKPAIFKFDNIHSLSNFLNQLDDYKSYFLDEYKYFSSIDETYASISNVLAVSKTIKYISLICLVICIVVSILILLLDINSRKKEIGILLSLGEKKSYIIQQFILELLIISLFSGFVAYFMTDKLSSLCINHLLDIQMNSNYINNFLPEGYQVNQDALLNVLSFPNLNESIYSMIMFFLLIFAIEISFMVYLINKIDPKDLLKDE